MITHILFAERYHLVPAIVKGFITTYRNDAQHRFLLLGVEGLDESKYDNLFSETGFSDYCFVYSKWTLIQKLWQNRHHSVLMHGEKFFYLIILMSYLFGNSNINWICWGSASMIKKGNRWRNVLNYIKRFLYHRLSNIVTLMEDDRKSLINDFSISSDKIKTISYASGGVTNAIDQACSKLRNIDQTNEYGEIKILIGNNPGNIPYYHAIIDKLSSFVGKIEVHCMMNYSVQKNDDYKRLLEHGKNVYDEGFILDENFYPNPEEYVSYMNNYDIYMCANPAQTGLGALYTMLQLGKKIYVTAKNYNWLKNGLNTIVFDVDEIGTYEEFVKPLTGHEKEINYEAIQNYKQQMPVLWHNYLKSLN